MNSPNRRVITIAVALLLAGCGEGEPEDVKQWMQESAAGLKGRVPELPQIKPLPEVVYEPGQLVSPFSFEKLFAEEARLSKASLGNGPKPVNPDAHPLTKAALENIRMVGTLSIKGEIHALLVSDRDTPRKVKVGDFIGQNFGRVVAIHQQTERSDGETVVKEMILEKGVWVERDNRIVQPVQGEVR